MCPVLSLANRAFLAFLGTLLAFTSLPAQAEELQFDLSGTAFTQDNGYYPGVGPIDISFVLDTAKSTSSFLFGNSCLQHFDGTASISNFNVVLNGQLMQSVSQALGAYGGDNANGTQGANFFSAMFLPSNKWWEFDTGPGASQAALMASNDPVATLFDTFQNYSSYTYFGGFNVDISRVSVTHIADPAVGVPEPGTLGLLVLGLAGVVLCKRISVRAPAISA